MTRVLEDVRRDTVEARSQVNGSGGGDGNAAGASAGGKTGKAGKPVKGEGGGSLALPKNVVEEGVRITRECLELVCEIGE
jgi:hypothetical protein